jgi:general secretion pathway protein D
LASENKEAKIDVSDEVPVASSETVISTASQPLVTTNIQYRDTGVILSVTPHINERGLVTLDISQEVSEQNEDDVEVAGTSYPAFFKRRVATTLTVEDGQTIVIGGLISEVNVDDEFGVPVLKDVPILGWLFKSKTKTKRRAELIILLTPRVIKDLEDVKRVTDEFKDRVGNVVKEINY